MKTFFEYSGCIHGHSIFSDGSGTYPEIIQAAQEAELDYLLMSDHMTLKGREEGFAGWYDNLLLSIGYEIQDPQDRHHYLVFGLDRILDPTLNHEEYIKIVKENGALGIAAHPFEARSESTGLPGYPAIPWGNLDYPEIEVIEIWNMMSHWLESTNLKNRYWNAIHPRSFSTHPSVALLSWWDQTNQKRKVTGIGSIDVHATRVKLFGLFSKVFFDYKIIFKSIRTHLLLNGPLSSTKTLIQNEKQIYDNIRQGQLFISNFRRGDARGFRFWAEADGKTAEMGETLKAEKAVFKASIPGRGDCRLIQNGKVIYSKAQAHALEVTVPKGVYRLEVDVNQRGWIYSNHIKIL
jgi:hypothetical protein